MKKIQNTKQWISVFFVIAVISLVGIIWQSQKKNTQKIKVAGGSFTEGIIGAPRFINPVLAQSKSDKDLTRLVFSSLLYHDINDNVVYDLAKDLQISEDKKTYTLFLKDNIYFHDGKKITIDDVIFTFEKIQDPLIKSPLENRWEGVRIEKNDKSSVKFTLDKPYSDFEKNLSIGILPKHIWKKVTSENFIFNAYNTNPIGSGNYTVKKVDFKKTGIPESYLLKKAKSRSGYIDQIRIFFFDNETELAEAYREGKVDSAYGLSANKSNQDLFDNEFEVTGKLPRVFGLFFNQNKQALLKNKNIRGIIDTGLDRQKIIDKVFAAYAYPTNNIDGNGFNADKENKLLIYTEELEKQGWQKDTQGIYTKDTQKLNFDLSTPNTKDLIQVAGIIKTELHNLGININIRTFDEGNLHQKVIRPREYEILLFGYMVEKETDLYAFWHSSQRNDPGLNISLYANSSVDKELEKLRSDKTKADLDKIKKEISQDIPAVLLYSPAYTYLLPGKIKGKDIFINQRHDRFNNISDWYIRTRSIWGMFIKK